MPRHFLAHLERTAKMLCVANHGNGDVTDKYGTYDGFVRPGVQTFESSTDRIRYPPPVDYSIDFEMLFGFQCPDVFSQFVLSLLVADGVDDDGKAFSFGVQCRAKE